MLSKSLCKSLLWPLTALCLIVPVASAQTGVSVKGTPKFTSFKGDTPGPNTRTVPHWSFNFTDPTNHVTYPIVMVGDNPANGTTTTIRTEIIPLKIRFSNGAILDGTNRVQSVIASPVFANNGY